MAMKIGAEDKKKVAILAGLGVVVLGLVIYNLVNVFGGGPTPPPVAQSPVVVQAPAVPARNATPSARSRATLGTPHEAAKISGPMAGLDPTLHPEIMAQAESIEYSGKGRNIFSMLSEPVIEPVKASFR